MNVFFLNRDARAYAFGNRLRAMVCALRCESQEISRRPKMTDHAYQEDKFVSPSQWHMHVHFIHVLRRLLSRLRLPRNAHASFDVGCGNEFLCGEFLKRGCRVVGIDLSTQGIQIARRSYPTGRFELLEANPDILERLDEEPFDLVISSEVVEHIYQPRDWAKGCYTALKRGGRFICTTPYHGYFKQPANLIVRYVGHRTLTL